MSNLPSVFGVKGLVIAAAIGFAAGGAVTGWAVYELSRVDVLRAENDTLQAEKALDRQEITNQKSTIDALSEAARKSGELAQLERSRADAAEAETSQIQKETDDAAALAAANAAHRPDVCNFTPAELDGMRRRLP